MNGSRKALLLAAGLGTRLKPFTNHHPKALYEVEGKPLLQHAIEHVKAFGFTNIIINLHHFSNQIVDYLAMHDNFGVSISFSEETDELLETGGGLKKCRWFLEGEEPFLMRNTDLISDLNLEQLWMHHAKENPLATLVVRERETSRYLLFNPEGLLSGWENRTTGERIITRQATEYHAYAFSGMQLINPRIFEEITEMGRFSIIDLYLRLSAVYKIQAFIDGNSRWLDAGKQ